jgi:hypothetical protein
MLDMELRKRWSSEIAQLREVNVAVGQSLE